MKEPEKMDDGQFRSLQTNFNLHGGEFVNYKKNKDIRVEVDGSDMVNGEPVHKLKVTDKAGDINYYFIDMKSGRLIKTMKKYGSTGNLYMQNPLTRILEKLQMVFGFLFLYKHQMAP